MAMRGDYRIVGLLLALSLGGRPMCGQDSLEKLLEQVRETRAAHQRALAALEAELASLKKKTALIEQILAESRGNSTVEKEGEREQIEGGKTFEGVAREKDGIVIRAPKELAAGVNSVSTKQTVSVKDEQQSVNLRVARPAEGANWESRAIMGFHQAGASSAPSTQKAFIDFYISRGLGNHRNLYDAKWSLWGNVRVASTPQQTNVPLSQFAAGFVGRLADVKVNDLAQGAEFQTGIERRLARWVQGDRIRTLGAVAFYGATGSFSDPFGSGQIFRIPQQEAGKGTNPHIEQFRNANFGGTPGSVILDSKAEFVGVIPPDRERFFRQYGGGLRLTSYDKMKRLAPPATYTVSLGQDQLITNGYYRGPVLRVDVFYPLPFDNSSEGKWKFLFLFGTVNMRIARTFNLQPLALEQRPICGGEVRTNCSNFFDASVRTVAVPSARDTYRIGVGLDFVNLVRSFLDIGTKAQQAAAKAVGPAGGN